jgi:hypothetical protein
MAGGGGSGWGARRPAAVHPMMTAYKLRSCSVICSRRTRGFPFPAVCFFSEKKKKNRQHQHFRGVEQLSRVSLNLLDCIYPPPPHTHTFPFSLTHKQSTSTFPSIYERTAGPCPAYCNITVHIKYPHLTTAGSSTASTLFSFSIRRSSLHCVSSQFPPLLPLSSPVNRRHKHGTRRQR